MGAWGQVAVRTPKALEQAGCGGEAIARGPQAVVPAQDVGRHEKHTGQGTEARWVKEAGVEHEAGSV